MKTIEQYKAAAIYFPPGRIVPNWIQRIVKGHKRNKRGFTFGAPVWVLPSGDRVVIFGATDLPGACLMRIDNVKGVETSSAKGMQNIFVVNGYEPITAQNVHSAITSPLKEPSPRFILGNRVKIKGTKLQRRRAKFAAKKEAQNKEIK